MRPEDVPLHWIAKAGEVASRAANRRQMDVHHGELLACVVAALAAVAPMIAKAERERCARVAEDYEIQKVVGEGGGMEDEWAGSVAQNIAAAIRALGDEDD